jgi:hypothetical protein
VPKGSFPTERPYYPAFSSASEILTIRAFFLFTGRLYIPPNLREAQLQPRKTGVPKQVNVNAFVWTAKARDILEKVQRARRALDNRHSA